MTASLSADEVLISYGTAYDTGVNIVTPYNNGVTDDDYVSIAWESDKYHDFMSICMTRTEILL